MGDLSFQNNVPDPLLAGKRIADFQIRIREIEGKSSRKQFWKRSNCRTMPISKGIAGVSMQLEPDVMRELHWHATAADGRSS